MAANEAFISCDHVPEVEHVDDAGEPVVAQRWVRVVLPEGRGPFEVLCPGCLTSVVINESMTAVRPDTHQVS